MANNTVALRFGGTATVPSWDRSTFSEEAGVEYALPLTDMRVHDAMATLLTGTATSDDMGLVTGTPGTDAPTLQGVDFGGTTSDEKCAFFFTLPPEYNSGDTFTVQVRAYMLTTVADTSCNVDVECWQLDGDGTVGGDLCATAAQSINSLTPASKNFTITPTGLSAGNQFVIRVSFAGTDSGNAGVMIPEISKVSVLLDIRG